MEAAPLRKLDEKVAALHLPALGASLTKLSKEQADYIGVKAEGRTVSFNFETEALFSDLNLLAVVLIPESSPQRVSRCLL